MEKSSPYFFEEKSKLNNQENKSVVESNGLFFVKLYGCLSNTVIMLCKENAKMSSITGLFLSLSAGAAHPWSCHEKYVG